MPDERLRLGRSGPGTIRRLLHDSSLGSWAEAVDMRDGSRRIVGLGVGVDPAWTVIDGVGWSPRVRASLADFAVDEGDEPADLTLAAAVAVAGCLALSEGRLCTGDRLEDRIVRLDGAGWVVIGADAPGTPGPVRQALAALILRLDPDDTLGVVGALRAELPVDLAGHLVAAFGRILAHERHLVVRRARRGGKLDAAARLGALAHRLHAAAPPPRAHVGEVHSDGARIFGPADLVIWDDVLDVRGARAAVRTLRGVDEGAVLRRWLVAALELRVERELLARRAG